MQRSTKILIGAGVLIVALGAGSIGVSLHNAQNSATASRLFNSAVVENTEVSLPHARLAAKSFCGMMDNGSSFANSSKMIVEAGPTWGINAHDMGIIVGAAVPEFCPKYIPAMKNYLRQ